ncbi:sulfur carrier protein [Methanococcus voltae]|uniref:MoaD/ThiS family protein n=1 Tax=Methanococcus voltae TaxID=2188 RepID=UPI001FD88646|nr:MoaD/ThiS family protein [Methanococcus voltae]MBP2144393.1 sulfur carrier protein [Methanococcus voltae]
MDNIIKVIVNYNNEEKTIEINENSNVNTLIKLMDLEDVLIVKNGEILSDDDILQNNDKLRILPVVSGG